ncbi:MAG: response regulator, partial [Caulobacteraceae bacterium]|nr:response regulator [Caulobacteraceae bacterium]
GGVAHDFNNLLMVVSGQADLLARRLHEEGQLKALDAIKAAATRGADLTRKLLSFARRQTLNPAAIHLADRLDVLRTVLKSSLGETIELVLDVGGDVWPIEADAAELELINLAVNARDAMPDGGRVLISARNLPSESGGAGQDFVALSVADSGQGMAPEVLAKAFDPFFTTKASGKGTGLGLSQVHGFAQQAGGDATAVSDPGQGCTVTLRLPRAAQAPDWLKPPRRAEPPKCASGVILLVEDNLAVAEVTSLLLQELGYQVIHETNATDAIGRLDTGQRIDLVLSDVVMPGPINGLALARLIRDQRPRLPVVLATGYSDTPGGVDGDVEILRKPFDVKKMADALATALHPAA